MNSAMLFAVDGLFCILDGLSAATRQQAMHGYYPTECYSWFVKVIEENQGMKEDDEG